MKMGVTNAVILAAWALCLAVAALAKEVWAPVYKTRDQVIQLTERTQILS